MAVFSGAELGGDPPELGEPEDHPASTAGEHASQADSVKRRRVTFATRADIRTYVVAQPSASVTGSALSAPKGTQSDIIENVGGQPARQEG